MKTWCSWDHPLLPNTTLCPGFCTPTLLEYPLQVPSQRRPRGPVFSSYLSLPPCSSHCLWLTWLWAHAGVPNSLLLSREELCTSPPHRQLPSFCLSPTQWGHLWLPSLTSHTQLIARSCSHWATTARLTFLSPHPVPGLTTSALGSIPMTHIRCTHRAVFPTGRFAITPC